MRKPDADRPPVLLAFHQAGGSTAAFAGWQAALGPGIEVVPVRLPGRGADGRSPRYHDLASLTRALSEDLAPRLAGPHLMYGHSMGAVIAYRLARLRAEQGGRPPERLIVGAHAAPHLVSAAELTRRLSDTELTRWLVDTSNIPSPLLAGSRLLDGILVRLREDLRLCATGQEDLATTVPLSCPIDVFAGADDPLVPLSHAADWGRYTSAGSTLQVIPGGHFFPRESRQTFFRELRAAVFEEQTRRRPPQLG